MAKFLESPIVYMGSKRRLMEQIIQYMPTNIEVFVDVFGGSGTVAMNAPCNKVILNELNTEIFNMYQYYIENNMSEIKEDVSKVLDEYGKNQTLTRDEYNKLRDRYNSESPRDVRKLVVLLRFAILSMIRVNKLGEFNTSYNNRVKTGHSRDYYIKTEVFRQALGARNATICNKDFRDLDYSILTQDDFVYFDPPYLITTSNYTNGWSVQDEIDLYNLLRELDKRGIRFGLSNVLTNKNGTNKYLEEFIQDYKTYHLNIEYRTYLGEQEEDLIGSDELYVTNVESGDTGITLF